MATNTLALSVDVDDLILSARDVFDLPRRDDRTNNRSEMRRLMDALDTYEARCTLFVPAYILEACQDALDDARDRGQEIACHGHRHLPAYRHSPAAFEDDLATAVDLIREATGITPTGYRAPGMTLLPVAEWAAPILQRHGFRDSSRMPGAAVGQNKFRNATPRPFRWPCGLLELPISTQRVFGLRIPVCGSVYTRVLPHVVIKHATGRFRRESVFPLYFKFQISRPGARNFRYPDDTDRGPSAGRADQT